MSVEEISFVKLMDALRTEHLRLHALEAKDYCPFCSSMKYKNALAELFDPLGTTELKDALTNARKVLKIKNEDGEEE